ncbi:MAG: S-methyl-5-thioribose-1-phosphate isomerase [Candidatus Bipolaricaulota bacterium]|nr:S-methyl-5-thioribose-1-phosphate isomerase [Candidatus Bipolaricaulota bacterium]
MTDMERLPSFNGEFAPIAYRDGGIDLLDQTKLPGQVQMLRITQVSGVAEAIRHMRVRGAPAIGITAAYGLVLAADNGDEIIPAAGSLRATRPTAVNLTWAIERMLAIFRGHKDKPLLDLRAALLTEAHRIHAEDIGANRCMGRHGAELLPPGATVLTICNTGALATGGYGTAYGVLRAAHEQGRLELVYACETRPFLQGARLTAWELKKDEIPFRLIVDSAAAYIMSAGKIDAVLAGADRIAQNGDSANKIGTYCLGVLAHHHGIPLYVVAPRSTIDTTIASGEEIPIEERPGQEITAPFGINIAPADTPTWNPAFDVTPASLIAAIVTETGVHRPPYRLTGKER